MTMSDLQFDFVICGYGPVGAVLANLLGRRGYSVAVFDRMPDIYDVPRAISFDHETMRAMQACGLAEEVSKIVVPHPGTRYLGMKGQTIRVLEHLPEPYPLGWSPAYMFVQPEFERLLRSGVERFNQVRTFLSTELQAFEQDAHGVSVRARPVEAGEEFGLRGRYLLACDGAKSSIRKGLGIGLKDLDFNEPWLVVDGWLKPGAKVPDFSVQYCQPDHPGTFVPGPKNLRRWEIKILPREAREMYKDRAAVIRRLGDFTDVTQVDVWRHATYQFHAVVAERWRDGRIFLVGDAAHQTAPFLAQGLCSGIRDAFNLFWKLDFALGHGATDALLDSYDIERRPHMEAIATLTKSFGKVIGELDPERAALRDARMEKELADPATIVHRQELFPRLEGGLLDLDADGRTVLPAGELCIQPKVFAAGEAPQLLDDRYGASLVLLAAADAEPLSAAASDMLRGLDGVYLRIGTSRTRVDGAEAVNEPDGLFAGFCEKRDCRYILKRPDGYIYGASRTAAGMERMLARLSATILPVPEAVDA